jgi:hypothetical protein
MKKQPGLLFCLLMDLIGYATYLLPFIGEWGDIIWAPVSAYFFYRAFGGGMGIVGGIVNFVEELFPGLDFIPTFTIAWIWQYRKNKQLLKNENILEK